MNFIEGTIELSNGNLLFNEGSFKVTLKPEMAEHVQQGQKVTFGIRPEDVRDRDAVPDARPEQIVTSRVEVIEPIGAEALWYLTTGQTTFVARVDSHARAEVNREKSLVFDIHKAHLFDPETEKTII